MKQPDSFHVEESEPTMKKLVERLVLAVERLATSWESFVNDPLPSPHGQSGTGPSRETARKRGSQ
jgi:hypothetical protein